MSTSARFSSGTGPIALGVENTARILDNQFKQPAFAAILNIVPSKSSTLIQPGDLTGATTINIGVGSATSAPFVGDKIRLLFTSAPGATVTLGTGILAQAGTLVIPATKTANISFMFNGASWIEEGRIITV